MRCFALFALLAGSGVIGGVADSWSAETDGTSGSWIYTENVGTEAACNAHADCPDPYATFGRSCNTGTHTTCCSDATHDVFTCGVVTEATRHFTGGGNAPGAVCGAQPAACPGGSILGTDTASLQALGAPCDAPATGTACGYDDPKMTLCHFMNCAAVDATPDAFSFTDVAGQALDTVITSNSITISGLESVASVSVSGDGAPQVRIDGGSWMTSGVIINGQTLEVRMTSAHAGGTARSATVNVSGGVSDSWSVTTEEGGPARR